MPKVIAYHDVKDTDHWLGSDRREAFFGQHGVSNIQTFVNPQDRTKVGISMDVEDLDRVLSALQTPEAGEAMDGDGVIAETVVLLVEE